MRASKAWGQCSCHCGRSIAPGDDFTILEGQFFLFGHETEELPLEVKRDYHNFKTFCEQKAIEDLPLFSKEIPTEQLSLF